MRIVCISDTHRMLKKKMVPEGDVLVHAGDFTNAGSLADVNAFNEVLGHMPHKHKVVIAGNHDFCFEKKREEAEKRLTNCIYLQDSEVVIDGVKFYGSPWQPEFYNWAFNLKRGPQIKEKWDMIPLDTDVLITHGPPLNHGGVTVRGDEIGCEDLAYRIAEVKPKLHVFGHNHGGYGASHNYDTLFINASICTERYLPTNKPFVYDYNVEMEKVMRGEERLHFLSGGDIAP